ncbi:MAG: DUF3596 domain-containing protein [Alphaproteobacteria bacterium]
MSSITRRGDMLHVDFRYKKQRCREATGLTDTPQHRRRLQTILKRLEAEMVLGTFDYGKYFPNSPRAEEFRKLDQRAAAMRADVPLFSAFAEEWRAEKKVEWRQSYIDTMDINFDLYLLPQFGKLPVNAIKKADLLKFRAAIASTNPVTGKTLSPARVNHIMVPLRMVLTEAADRYEFVNPYRNIKPLKEPRVEVEPFTLPEVKQIIDTVRPDYKNYYTVRFFTGLRSSEIDGLPWKNVDFERREVLVHQAYVQGKIVPTKTDGSFRAVQMNQLVFDALQDQKKATGELSDFVFCTRNGLPLQNRNVTQRVWYPLLRHLGLRERRPYQTRHTAATLWLAAGEAPEWIAKQMGHTTTKMLFNVYSRYVPNLTRQDGSAFDRLLAKEFEQALPINPTPTKSE